MGKRLWLFLTYGYQIQHGKGRRERGGEERRRGESSKEPQFVFARKSFCPRGVGGGGKQPLREKGSGTAASNYSELSSCSMFSMFIYVHLLCSSDVVYQKSTELLL